MALENISDVVVSKDFNVHTEQCNTSGYQKFNKPVRHGLCVSNTLDQEKHSNKHNHPPISVFIGHFQFNRVSLDQLEKNVCPAN